MKNILRFLWKIIALIAMTTTSLLAQDFDILIKNGRVIDCKNNLDQVMDVAIKDGKIARIAPNIPAIGAKSVINAKGLIVTAGLLDIHGHNFYGTQDHAYLSNGYSSLPPDGFTFRNGVTTIVDVGGAGWKNFRTFKEQTIDRSRTRVLSFLNIVGSGMKGGAIEQNIEDMNPKMTAYVAKQNAETIVGVKLAHYSGFDWEPVNRAVAAGRQSGIPVMIDFGGSDPELSLETLLMEKLRPGDIFTHAYAHVEGRTPILDEDGNVRKYIFQAQKRGVVFDVGHGGGSFLFEQAIPTLKQGFFPNSISTDLHTGSMNGGMKDILNVMSKFINMDMTLYEVIGCVTWNPAQYIKRTDLGHLSIGAVADVAILNLRKGRFGFLDTKGKRINGDQKLECELTIREGEIVWDLNGLSGTMWEAKETE